MAETTLNLRNDISPGTGGQQSLTLWLFFSVGLHALLLFLQLASPSGRLENADRSSEPIELAELPPPSPQRPPAPEVQAPQAKPPPARDQQIAETEHVDNNKLDPKAKFLSDKNQQVEKETRAKRIDDFRKKEGTGAKGTETAKNAFIPPTGEKSGEENGEKDAPKDELDVADGSGPSARGKSGNSGVKRDWKTLSLKDLSVDGDGGAAAATDDQLNGVAEGERTVLSTREFRYFSYYHRIKELLRQHWKPTVERKLLSIWSRGKNVGEDEMITKVLVLLDTKGQIQKVSRVGSSGYAELDEAAVESFQKAGPFPNPPPGLIENDGFVRIRWDFILKTEASPVIQFQGGGGQSAPF